jgi:CRP/FNR family transcriptional regulator
MEQIVFMSFDKRLATFLLEQSEVEGTIKLRITHEEIAQHIGTAREVVSRMLKYFVSEGFVRLSRGGIELSDTDKLKRLTV